MKIRAKGIAAAVTAVAMFTATAGITGAYLVDSPGKLENVITRGAVTVKVTEPGWVPEKATGLTPGSVIAKDPAAVNTGKNDAWVFLKVKVPVKKISLVDEKTGRKQAAKKTELLGFDASGQWELVERTEGEADVSYIYGYRSIVKPGEKTEALFSEVALVNYLEGEIDDTDTMKMPIEAVSVQSDICASGNGLKTVYQEYLKQKGLT